MFHSSWVPLTGMFVGLWVHNLMSEWAYGTIGDMLLGLTGAYASSWLMENLPIPTLTWTARLAFLIWGAVALPALVHLLAKKKGIVQIHRSIDQSPINPDSAKLEKSL